MIISNFNLKYKGVEVKDAGEKLGRLIGGEKGATIGKTIDEVTKEITIELDNIKKKGKK